MQLAEENGWLPESQAAFRNNRSCDDHQFVLDYLLERALNTAEPVLIGFLDLKKAFDTVDRSTL